MEHRVYWRTPFFSIEKWRTPTAVYTVSQKTLPTYLLLSVKYESMSIQIGTNVLEETANKTVQKLLTLPTACASSTLGILKWQIELSMQYLHRHFNESLNSYKTTGSYRLENRRTCSKSHLYIVCSKCLSPARTIARRRWRHDANHTFNERVIHTVHSFLMRLHNFSTSEADIASM